MLYRVTTGANNMNQSAFETVTCSSRLARENASEQVNGFWFLFSLAEKVAHVLLTNRLAKPK